MNTIVVSSWASYQPFIDDPSPFSKLRGLSAASKQSPNVQAAQPSVRVNTAAIRPGPLSRPAISAQHQVKQSVPSTSKRGQAVRVAPIPPVRSGKRSQTLPPARPATAAGRVTSTLRTATAPMTSRIPTRPATSASLRAPMRVKNTTNARAGEAMSSAKSEFALEFNCIEDAAEDFMFDV